MSFSFEINHRLLADIRHEPRQPIESIHSYGQAPLVSLDRALRPVEALFGAELQQYIAIAQASTLEPRDGLSADEAASIYLYTMEWEEPERSLADVFNRALRTPDRSVLEPWWSYMRLFFTGLEKLPSTEFRTLWRGVADDLSALYREGDEMKWWSVSSATSSMETLQSPMYLGRAEKRTIFAIESKSGKPIRAHSHLQNDDEFLFLPGIRLRVMGSIRQPDGTHVIRVREIEWRRSQPIRTLAEVKSDLSTREYRNPRVEELILSTEEGGNVQLESMQLTDRDMNIVADLAVDHKRCRGLSLSNNAITAIGAAILARALQDMTGLMSLTLRGNPILDAGIQSLADAFSKKYHGLISLYADGVGVTDAGCESIANIIRMCGRLRFLTLNDNSIGDRGVRTLCEPIVKADYCGLTLMALSGNKSITDASLDVLCAVIREGYYFHNLNLVGCGLSGAAKETLRMAAAQRTSFTLHL